MRIIQMSNEELLNPDLAAKALATIERVDQEYKLSPLEHVESSIAYFINKAIDATIASNRLSAALEDSLIQSLDSMKNDEKIALYNIERTASNDRLSKLITPTIGAIAQQEQARIQMLQAKQNPLGNPSVQVNIGGGGNPLDAQVAASVDPSISTGLDALFNLTRVAANLANKNSETKSESQS